MRVRSVCGFVSSLRGLLTGLALLAPLAGGCAAKRDIYATGAPEAYGSLGYRLAWGGFPLMEPGARVRFVEEGPDVLALQTDRGAVSVLEKATGRLRWSTGLGGPTTNFVGMATTDDALLVASDTDLYIFDLTTGGQTARHAFSVIASTPPAPWRDFALFGSTTSQAFAHDLVTGFKAWGYLLGGSITARPVVHSDSALFVSQAGDVLIVDPADGSSRSRDRIYGGLQSDPIAGGGAFYFASLDQALYAYSAVDGSLLWRRLTESPLTTQPAYVDGVVYVDLPNEGLLAVDASTGRDKWLARGVHGTVVGMRKGRLLVWSPRGVSLVDPASGAVESRVELPSLAALRMSPTVDGDLYAISRNGVVTKYAPAQ